MGDNPHSIRCDQGRINEPRETTEGKKQLLSFSEVFAVPGGMYPRARTRQQLKLLPQDPFCVSPGHLNPTPAKLSIWTDRSALVPHPVQVVQQWEPTPEGIAHPTTTHLPTTAGLSSQCRLQSHLPFSSKSTKGSPLPASLGRGEERANNTSKDFQ